MKFDSKIIGGISYRLALTAALMLSVVALAPHVSHAQGIDRIDRERAQQMLNTIKGDLKSNYYDPTFHGMDVDARFKAAEEKIKQATSFNQALGTIAQALLDLNDSHTFFLPPARSVNVEYGWKMQAIGDKVFVSLVKPGSDAAAKGIKEGDELLSVDGFKPSRKELWKMEYYYNVLSPRPGMRLVAQSPGAAPREVDVAAKVKQLKRVLDLSGRGGTSDMDINDAIRESEDYDRQMRHRFQKLPGVVIWKMPTFSFVPEDVDRLMGEVGNSSALILDLRGNGGGYVVTLERLVSHFFDREVKIGDLKGRKEMKPQVAKKRGSKPFEGKLVVLVDSESGSAAELFARVMQLEKRGIVVGDRSGGHVMQSRRHGSDIGGNTKVFYGASITNADVIMADGKSLEHVGVIPDELVLPTGADMAARRDPVLARAAAILGVQLDPAKAGAMFPIEWK